MNSGAHALVSLAVGGVAVAVTTPPVSPLAVVAVAVAVGVGIDADHFLVARYNAGNWRALRACLRDPRRVFFDQGAIFEPGEVDAVERLATHLAIGGVAVAVLWLFRPYLAVLVAVTLYAHVLADVIATVRSVVVVDPDEVTADCPVSATGAGADAGDE